MAEASRPASLTRKMTATWSSPDSPTCCTATRRLRACSSGVRASGSGIDISYVPRPAKAGWTSIRNARRPAPGAVGVDDQVVASHGRVFEHQLQLLVLFAAAAAAYSRLQPPPRPGAGRWPQRTASTGRLSASRRRSWLRSISGRLPASGLPLLLFLLEDGSSSKCTLMSLSMMKHGLAVVPGELPERIEKPCLL